MKKEKYHTGKLPKLWELLVTLHQESPQSFSSAGFLRATVANRWKLLEQKEVCPNCQASMQQYTPTFDYFDAKLLKGMAEMVREKVRKGITFTEANAVHVQSLPGIDYTTKSRTTKCRQLGLIAKVKKENGSHDQEKGWLITSRGWTLLHGSKIPKQVTVFRNEIIERSGDTTTMQEVMTSHKEVFEPRDWVTYGDYQEGKLL